MKRKGWIYGDGAEEAAERDARDQELRKRQRIEEEAHAERMREIEQERLRIERERRSEEEERQAEEDRARIARIYAVMPRNQIADALTPNRNDYKRLTATIFRMDKYEWLRGLWPFVSLDGQNVTHRIYLYNNGVVELTSDTKNRARLLDLLDEAEYKDRAALSYFMVQEVVSSSDLISPFFDLEPDEKLYAEGACRRSGDRSMVPPELEFGTILAILARAFSFWPRCAWIVHRRRSDSGFRYHIRVRLPDGKPALVNRFWFHQVCKDKLEKLLNAERNSNPTKMWLGWDLKPLETGQMRFSNSAKCLNITQREADDGFHDDNTPVDFARYRPLGVYFVEDGVPGPLTQDFPYPLYGCRASCSLPFGEKHLLVATRNLQPNAHDIFSRWEAAALALPGLQIPTLEHLSPELFSFEWSVKRPLQEVLASLPKHGPEEWDGVIKKYVRVEFGVGHDDIWVLTPNTLVMEYHKDDGAKANRVRVEPSVHKYTRDAFKKQFGVFKYKEQDPQTKKWITITFDSYVFGSKLAMVRSAKWMDTPLDEPTARIFNRWPGPAITPNEAIDFVKEQPEKSKRTVRLFLQHLRNNLCGGNHHDPKIHRYNMWCFSAMLHFCHMMLVRPFSRSEWQYMVVMQGPPGCGKGTLFKILQQMIGLSMTERMEGSAQAEKIAGQFTSMLHSLLVLFDEVDKLPPGLLSVLKSYTTEEQAKFEQKGRDASKQSIFTRIMITFNELSEAPKLDVGERRMIVFEGAVANVAFWKEYYRLLFEEDGVKAVAAYLYTLHRNQDFFDSCNGGVMTGPRKASMLQNSSELFALLCRNSQYAGWYGDSSRAPFVFYYEDVRAREEEKSTTQYWVHLHANPNVSETNYWMWYELGDGYSADWPFAIPLESLALMLNNGTRPKTSKEITQIETELTETLKHSWPAYVMANFEPGRVQRALATTPVLDMGVLMQKVRDKHFVLQDGRYTHRGCHELPAAAGFYRVHCTHCDRPGWSARVDGWVPWAGDKPDIKPLTGRVLLLPKREHAAAFFRAFFPGVSDIDKVHFPRNWSYDHFAAFVDSAGANNPGALIHEELDEELYSQLAN